MLRISRFAAQRKSKGLNRAFERRDCDTFVIAPNQSQIANTKWTEKHRHNTKNSFLIAPFTISDQFAIFPLYYLSFMFNVVANGRSGRDTGCTCLLCRQLAIQMYIWRQTQRTDNKKDNNCLVFTLHWIHWILSEHWARLHIEMVVIVSFFFSLLLPSLCLCCFFSFMFFHRGRLFYLLFLK